MDWEVGYVAGGSTQALREFATAVKDGADVKVWYIAGTGTLFVRELPSVAVAEDEDQGIPTVCGALTDLIDTQVDSTTGRDVDRPLMSEWQAYNTGGRRPLIKWRKRPSCRFWFFCRKVRPAAVQDSQLGISWLIRRGWENIYEHEADGTLRSGSLDALLFFAQEGYDIKVRYFAVSGSQDVVWFRTLRSVTTFQSPGVPPVISGMLSNIPTTTFDITSGEHFSTAELVFSEPFATEWHIYNTTGKRRLVQFRVSDGRVISDEIKGLRVGWYVRRTAQVGKAIEMDKRSMPAITIPK